MNRRSIGLAFGVHMYVSFGGGGYMWRIEMSGKGKGREEEGRKRGEEGRKEEKKRKGRWEEGKRE